MEDILLITTFKNKSRELRYLINEILKKGLASYIKRINYVKSYEIQDGKIIKNDEKLLIMKTTQEKKEKLVNLIKIKDPDCKFLSPEELR